MNDNKEKFMAEYLERDLLGWHEDDLRNDVYKQDVWNGETAPFETWLMDCGYQKVGEYYYTWEQVEEAEQAYKDHLKAIGCL